jgi:hypothetical protein
MIDIRIGAEDGCSGHFFCHFLQVVTEIFFFLALQQARRVSEMVQRKTLYLLPFRQYTKSASNRWIEVETRLDFALTRGKGEALRLQVFMHGFQTSNKC